MKPEALIGRTIAGKYEIETLVGQGAMGAVYKARQITLGSTLALKVLHGQLAGDPMFAARFLREAQAALAVAHDIGVIHRDLKPENIMIIEGADDEGRTHDIVKVCDFGVVKILQGSGSAPSVTAEGVVIGTPEYMSPEQARGETLD